MKKILFLGSIMMMLLAACSTHESSKEDHKSKSNQNNVQKAKKNESDKKDETSSTNTSKLSTKERLALAFCIDGVDQYTLTKNEILTGIYEYRLPTGKHNYKLVDFTLVKMKQPVKHAPKHMQFFTVYPDKSTYQALIGVNKDTVYVGRMQKGTLDYNDLLDKGKEASLEEVYKHNKDNKALPELISKMHISNSLPDSANDNGNPLASNDLEKSGSVNTRYRNEVYQLISDFDEVELKKSGYLWDDVKMTDHNGNWIVNYRNKKGEILGTYRTKHGKIQKLDEKGNIVKEEK